MDQSYEMEECSNNETKTESVPLCSPNTKPDVESDPSMSPKLDSVMNESEIKIEEDGEAQEKSEEDNEEKNFVQESSEVDKNEDLSGDASFEDKSEKWKLKLDIYSSTSSSSHEDSETEEQKQLPSKLTYSVEMNQEVTEAENPNKSDIESDFLGFESEPDPSGITAIYQKLIAKSEAAVDIDKWSSCSGSVTSLYSDYNSDDGDQRNHSPPIRERYDTFSERDDDEVVSSSRTNYDSMEYAESGSSSNVTGEPLKISSSMKKRIDGSSGSSSRGKRQAVDASNPAFKIPFTLGWKREVVFRSTVDGGANNKRLADIYYYTPSGKKMRSSREVVEYLEETRSPLTAENFTFLKDCIHPDDPNLEIIREAKKITVKEDGPKNKRARSKSSTPTMGSPHPDWSSESASPLKGKTTPVHSASYPIKGGSRRKIFSVQGLPPEVGMYSPPWTNLATNGSPRYEAENLLWSGSSKKDTNMIMPCSLRCPGLHGVVPTLQCHICVCLYHPECVGGVPINIDSSSYICKNCERESKENHVEGSAQTGKHTTPPPLVPIDKLGKASPTHSYPPTAPPRLQRFPQLQNEGHQDRQSANHSGNAFARYRPPMFIRGVVGNSGTTRPQVGFQFTDSLTRETSLGQSLAVMQGRKYVIVPKNILSVLPGAANAAAAAAAAFSGGTLSRGSIIPISREWLCSHPITKSSTVKVPGGTFIPPSLIQPTSSQPLVPADTATLQPGFVQRAHDMKPQYVIVSSPVQSNVAGSNRETGASSGSAKTAAPKSTQPIDKEFSRKSKGEIEASRKRKLAAFAMEPGAKRSKSSQANGVTPSDHKNGEALEDDECNDEVSDRVTAAEGGELSKVRRDLFSQHFMSNLSLGYSALLHVFHYLNVQDLLRAAMVCRMWRDLAGGHHSLWRTVRMKNSQVVDWVGFADTLARNRTEILDLRKMLLPPSISSASYSGGTEESGSKNKDRRNQWGQEFCRAISRASGSLRRVDLCRCGMDVLEGVASACPLLTALCAQAIRSHDLNMEFVGKLTHLQELRLKSPSGMNLVGDLSELKKLTSLKHLSLTTVRDLVGDDGERLSILSSLINLESLELGECSSFGETACEALGSLTHLVRLRLEKGQVGERLGNMVAKNDQESPPKGLLVALAKLPLLAQLELVNFDIGPGFDKGLAQCTSLRRLLIIPTYVAQSATSNHLVMSGAMKLSASLHNFTWGVTHEVLQAIELFVASDQANSSKAENSSSGEDQEEGKRSHKGKNLPSSECLSILKPLPSAANEDKEEVKEDEVDSEGDKFSRVEFVPLPKLHGLLSAAMPSTKVQIVKMPFSATWRQGMSEVDL